MVATLFDCVGGWFEDVVQEQFPDLRRTDCNGGVNPDFECDAFSVEAKVGFWDYGAQLKEAQVNGFQPNGKPIVYMVGYHNAEGLRNRTAGMNPQQISDLMKREAGMHSAYLVSNSIIQKLWRRENHTAASNPEWKYFSLRPRHLDAIIQNRPFTRSGTKYMPSRWYRISRKDLLLKSAPLLEGSRDLKFGTILDSQTDQAVIEYMAAVGAI